MKKLIIFPFKVDYFKLWFNFKVLIDGINFEKIVKIKHCSRL